MDKNMVQLSEAIAADTATLGWNAHPEGWVWVAFEGVAAWVHPDWAGRIIGVVDVVDVVDVVKVVDNLLWAARELAAGRELAVEGANYLCDAQDWLNAQK